MTSTQLLCIFIFSLSGAGISETIEAYAIRRGKFRFKSFAAYFSGTLVFTIFTVTQYHQ